MKKPKTGKYRSLVSAFLCCALLAGLLPTAVYADTSPVEEHSANTVQTDETADGSSNKGSDRREDRSAAVSNDSASSDTKAAAKESAAGKTDAADGKKDQKSEQPSDASRQTSSGNDAEEKAAESSEKKTAAQADEGRHAAESEKGTVQLKASTGSRVDVQTAFSGKTFETTPKLTVSDVSEQEAEAAVKKALGRDTKVLGAVGADITFLANGQEVQPADGAQVSVTMKWQDPLAEKEKNVSYVLIHVHNGEAARMKSAEVSDTRVSFSADSFSEYIAAAVQDTGEVGTAQANASDTRIKIDYDETTNIHSVDNRNIILFCMNNQMHWPHDTPTFQAPEYVSVDFNDFFKDKENAAELAQRLKVLLYAGYPYNGLGLYEISDHGTISEAEFNLLLNPPEWIRTDFPDSIGSETFTYADLKDRAKMAKLTQFIKDSMALYTGGKTASGRTYQEVSSLPFWKAAYCMTQFSSDPREAYTQLYNSGYYVTESQAYENTSHAVWKLMYDYGVDHNNISSLSGFELAENLLKKASKDEKILENEPTSDVLSISGNSTFTYDPDQKIWQTGTLTLKAPENYHGKFTLALPAGVSTEDGSITVQPGGSFRLISTKTPEDQSTVSLSASLVWMDGGLRMYTPAAAATASDGKGFQNMIGAVIRKKEVSASVTLSRKDDTTAVSVEKVWKDGDNQDGIRPKEVTIHLLADGKTTGKSVTLNAENNWKETFTDLDVYASGKKIAYTVSEDGVKNYDAEITGTAKDGYTVTNTHTPEQTSVSVEKVWKDGDNQDGIRPKEVTIHLLADGKTTGKSVTLNAENNWKASFDDLAVYNSGKKIAYTVTEDGVKNYDAEITGTAKDGYTVTNTHAPEQTSVSVEKVWKDGDNQDGIRPKEVTIHLLADGNDTGKSVTLNAENNWKETFTDLDVYASGKKIAYTVSEDGVKNYDAEITGTAKDGYTVTNTHTPEQTSVSVEKVWKDGDNQDGIRPKEVTIHLLADGKTTGKSVTLNAENNWKASFDDLAVYNSGKEIAYTVTEDGVKNYDAEITGTAKDGYTVTNTHTPEQTSVSVEKVWKDGDNQDGIRPEKVTIHLLADGKTTGKSVTLNAENNWKASFDDLAVYNSGKEIAYTVTEDGVKNYDAEITGTAKDGYTVTNTHTPEQTSVSVEKVWKDGDNQDGIRPEKVTIHLLADGNDTGKSVTLNADNNWKASFDDLAVYNSGKEIAYTVTEDEVNGYTPEVSGTAKDGYTVTNIHTPKKNGNPSDPADHNGKKPTAPTDTGKGSVSNGTGTGTGTETASQPNTGDTKAFAGYAGLLAAALAAGAGSLIWYRKKRKISK